jgi:hypothetical protein
MTAASSDFPQRKERPAAMPAVSVRGALIGLVVAAGVIDFLFFPLARASGGRFSGVIFFGAIYVGFVFGQVMALAAWLVWNEGPFLRRLAIHWGIAFGLAAAFFCGLIAALVADSISRIDFKNAGLAFVVCTLPAVSLAAQLPFWPLRTYFGWRVHRTLEGASLAGRPLTILDMFFGTAVVGATLGLARLITSLFPNEFFPPLMWIQLAVYGALWSIASLFIGIPTIFCIMRSTNLARGIAALGGYLLFGLVLLIGIPSALRGIVAPLESSVTLTLGTFTLAATFSAPLLVLRACGYRLTRTRDRRSLI